MDWVWELQDAEGNWHAGSIATVIDDVAAAAIMTAVGHIKVSVDFSISYFSPAKINVTCKRNNSTVQLIIMNINKQMFMFYTQEELEVEARVIEHKGKLTAVTAAVRKKGNGTVVALGRQWMASSHPRQRRSNL